MMEKNKGYIFALLAALIWCGFILVSRIAGVSELTAFDVIAIRYLTSASILLPIWWFGFRFNLLDRRLVICSLVGGLGYTLTAFQGFKLAPASHAAILLPGLMPLFILVLSWSLNKESFSGQRWLGIFIITVGVSALFIAQLSFQQVDVMALIGDGWLILAALFWAIFSVLIKRWQITPWQVTVSLAVITCAIYLPVYLAFLPKAIVKVAWPDILLQGFYQGVMATIVQMIFYVKAVERIGPASMGAVMSIVPVVSGIAAILFFNEVVNAGLITGLVLVSLGAWFSHSRYIERKIIMNNTITLSK